MNIGNIIANLTRYRKPAVADDNETGLLASTDNEIAEHIDTRKNFGSIALLPRSDRRTNDSRECVARHNRQGCRLW